MGEFDLMRLAFLLDLGLYYLGVASQPFKRGAKALTEPVFSTPPSTPFFHLISAYNRRFARIARVRRLRKVGGRCNDRHRFMFGGYTFALGSAAPIIKAVASWGWLEITEGWRSWFGNGRQRREETRTLAPEPAVGAPSSLPRPETAQIRNF